MSTQTGSISFESTGNFSQVVKQNYATLSQIKGQFAVCSTGASTTEKIATTVPTNADWTLYAGATVTVKFTSANTASVPTLNVNGSGPKEIRDYNANELLKAAREWPAGAAIAFTYDGTYWRIQDSKLMERVHSAETRVDQTATSITSLASMEDNYTKPDGTTAKNNMKSYVDQTAEGITTTITNISEKIETIANPNLGPFFMWPLTDIYNATTNPNGFWRSMLSHTITKLDDGWAHITLNNASGTSAKYATAHVAKDAVPVTSGTLLVEIANISTDITESTGNALWVDFSKVVDGTQVPQVGSSAAKYFFDNGAYYIAATPTNNENPERWSRSWFGISAGHTAEFDARISFYEGTYDGPYKPYVPISEYIETKSTVNSVKQTADSNSAHISNLTTVLGTNADGTTKSTDIVHKYNELDQTLEGTVSAVGKIQSEIETVANANLSPWFSESISNIYNGTDNPNGYWRRIATNTSFSVYDMQQKHNGSGGWAHFVGNVTSGNPFVRFEPMPISLKPSTEYTFMLEIDGTFASTLTNVVWKLAESTETDAFDLFSVKAELVSPESVTSGVYYIKTTTRADIANATTLSRAYLQFYGTGAFDVYARISLYEGDYSGPYKPYVDPTLSSRLTNAETMIAQNADSIALSATKEELNNINNNIKSIKSTCGRTLNIEDAANLPLLSLDSVYGECIQSGTPTPDIHIPIKSVSPVGGEKNLLPSILNVSRWTKQSEPSGSNMVISNYNTGIHYTWTGVSGYEIVRVTSAFSVIAGQKYRLRCKYNINKICNRRNAARPFGLSVRKEISGSEDQTSADFIGVAEFQTAVGTNLTTELIFTAPTNKIYLMLNGGMSVDSVDHSVDVWDIELTTGSLEIVSSTGDIAYLDMTDSSTGKPVELYSLNDTYRDVLIIDSSGHALVEKRTYKLYANQLVASDYGTNPKDETLGLELNVTGTDPDGIDRFNKVQLGGKTTGYPLPICTFLNGASNASSWTGGSAVLNTIAGTTNSYPHNMYCCVSSSKYANYTAFNTALQNELANEYVIVGLYKDYWYTIDLGYVNLPEVADDTTVHVVAEIQPQICGSWWTKNGEKTGIVHQSSVKENAELHITADGISSEVSKVTSIKYYNSATPSWTLSGIKTYAAEGHSDSWNISSATPLTDLRVGDTVYVKGTDSTRNCPVYIKITVTSIDSLSRFTGISHGYEDVLPVETIKSTINQSSDSVKIQAKHIEIDGTATFKNSDNTTTTLGNYLNTNYDEKGAAAAVQNNLNNLEIGGRNLLRKTGSLVTSDLVLTRSTVADGVINVTPTTSSSYAKFIVDYLDFNDYGDGVYTVSFDARAIPNTTYTNLKGPMVYPGINIPSRLNNTLSSSYDRYRGYTLDTLTYEWVRYSQTFSIPGDLNSGQESALASGSFLTVQFAMTSSYAPMQVRNVKLEVGNVATDWTPAPEDTVSETQRIYYRTSLEETPTAPTSWVTTNVNKWSAISTSSVNWTTKVTPIANGTGATATKFLYLYTCTQTRYGDGTLINSAVLLDDSTTVIDGGKIITGTVTANAIKADSGTFNTANIPNLDAAKITSGSISADRIKANVVSAINATANKIDAKNINVSEINIGDLAGEVGGRNLLAVKDFITVANGPDAIDQDGWCTDSTPTGDSRTWGYANSNWKLSLDAGTYTLSWDVQIAPTDSNAKGVLYSSGGSIILDISSTAIRTSGSGTFSLNSTTSVGLMVKVYGGKIRFKLERGNVATDWTPAPEDVDSAIDDASKIASNYIHADSTGINIYDNSLSNANKYYLRQTAGGTYIYRNSYLKAKYEDTITLYGGSSASGANPRITLGESITDGGTARQSLCFYDNSGNRRLKINAGVGLIIGLESKGHTQITDAGVYFYDTNNKKRTQVDANGLTIYDASATPVDIANFGTSVGTTDVAFARIGKNGSTRFEISPKALRAYDGTTKYFEVSASGLKYGNFIGATTEQLGNKNLIRNGNFVNSTNYWVADGATITVENDSTHGKVLKVVTSSGNYRTYPNTSYMNHGTGTYSINFYAKASAACTLYVCKGGSIDTTNQYHGSTYSLTTSWQNFTGSLTTTGTGSLSFKTTSAATFYLAKVMVVNGSKAVTFEPHPLDIQNDADNAAKTASNYISLDSTNGLKIASSSPSSATRFVQIKSDQVRIQNDDSNYAYVDTNGLTIYKGGDNVANFGTTTRIGKLDSNYISIDSTSGISLFYSEHNTGSSGTTAITSCHIKQTSIDLGYSNPVSAYGFSVEEQYKGTYATNNQFGSLAKCEIIPYEGEVYQKITGNNGFTLKTIRETNSLNYAYIHLAGDVDNYDPNSGIIMMGACADTGETLPKKTTITMTGLGINIWSPSKLFVLNEDGAAITGRLSLGYPNQQQSAAPAGCITIQDTRNYTWKPASLDKGINWYFTKSNSPNTSKWWAIQHVKGWTGDYNAWELAGTAADSDERTSPLYVRTGRTTNGWGSWRKIYDTSNKPTTADMATLISKFGSDKTASFNTTGSNGTITLTETAANFTIIDIFFKGNGGYYDFTRVYNPNGKTVNLATMESSTGSLNCKWKAVAISGTSISTKVNSNNNCYAEMDGNGTPANVNHIYICGVVGYK